MRLGDLDALMHRFMDKPPEYYHTSYIVGEINTAPTVDAVPVVRCKDCRYWQQKFSLTEHWVCTHHSYDERKMYTMPDFYCADGEKGSE